MKQSSSHSKQQETNLEVISIVFSFIEFDVISLYSPIPGIARKIFLVHGCLVGNAVIQTELAGENFKSAEQLDEFHSLQDVTCPHCLGAPPPPPAMAKEYKVLPNQHRKANFSVDLPTGILLNRILKISSLVAGSGSGTKIILSILPGLISASSMRSGLFVAATTTTPLSLSIPSISVRICAKTRSPTPDCCFPPR